MGCIGMVIGRIVWPLPWSRGIAAHLADIVGRPRGRDLDHP